MKKTTVLLAKPGTALTLTSAQGNITIAVPAQAPDPVATVIALDVKGPAKLEIKN